MPTHVILLRAVNVGGTGKLPMADLRAMAADAGLANPRTYIASGNLIAESPLDEAGIKAALEPRLAAYAGKPVGVLVRSASEMAQVLAANPFPDAPGNRMVAVFLDAAPPADALATVSRADDGEQVALGTREIYIRYGDNMGRSKLRVPAAAAGTARNLNSVAALAKLAAG